MPLKSVTEAYRILEIHSSSSQSEVKSAYKRLALKTHPDKNRNDPNANAKFQQVTEAFQMLMKVNNECIDVDEELSDDLFGEDFFPADFAEVIFHFVFSGNGRTFTSFGTSEPACSCIDCQFKRFFTQQKETNAKAAPKTEFKSQYSFTPSSSSTRPSPAAYVRTPPPTSTAKPVDFDPHADWLSEGEGEVQPSKPKRFKKISKKKKTSRRRDLPGESKNEESDGGADENDSSQEANEASSEEPPSSLSSVSAEKKSADFILPSEANESAKWRAFPAPKKSTFKRQAHLKAGKNSSYKSKSARSPRTPTMNYTQSSPRTPNSVATTHVGTFSAPTTPKPKPARTKTGPNAASNGTSDASTAARASARPKQPYVTPTVPTLEGVQLCRIFLLKHGKCRYGDRCKFSHGIVPGAALAAAESDEGLAISPSRSPVRRFPLGMRAAPFTVPTNATAAASSASPTRAQFAVPSSPEPVPVPSPVPITLSPKAPRSTGRAQVTVNPSIGGFGRKAAPRERSQKRAAHQNVAAPVLNVPHAASVPPQGRNQTQTQGQNQKQKRNQRQRGPHKGQTDTAQQTRSSAQSNRFNALFDPQQDLHSGDGDGDRDRDNDSCTKPICVFYNTPGGCVYGVNCRFAHELR